jgi:hypothetical protein
LIQLVYMELKKNLGRNLHFGHLGPVAVRQIAFKCEAAHECS